MMVSLAHTVADINLLQMVGWKYADRRPPFLCANRHLTSRKASTSNSAMKIVRPEEPKSNRSVMSIFEVMGWGFSGG